MWVKYYAMDGRKGKKILTVTIHHDDKICYINVADNGPGMSPELLEKVKQGFFTTKQGGTGLGLAVTQEIIDGHQGKFDIQSEQGKGTKILTSLPIYNPVAPVVSPTPSVESVA